MTDDYKGGRDATPVEIEHQFALIRTLCEALRIPVLGVTNFEADDVLATLATWGRDAKIPVVVVSGDRDTFQLVEDPYVRVLYNRRGVSDYTLYDEAGIVERCGVEPARYPLLAALRGDVSDNLPGVPGVGEKTAAKLLAQYGDFDDLFAHLEALTPKLRENLSTHEARARNNEAVMRLVRDVPLDFTLGELTLGGWDRQEVASFFERYEMNSMRSRVTKLMNDGLFGESTATSATLLSVSDEPITLGQLTTLDRVLEQTSSPVVAYHLGRVAVFDESTKAVAVVDVEEFLHSAGHLRLVGHDLKGLYRAAEERGLTLLEPLDDTSIMAFLIDASSGHYDLADVALRYLHESNGEPAASLFSVPTDETLLRDVLVITRLRGTLRSEVERWELEHVYDAIELPLVMVIGRMEARGIRVDVELLRTIAHEFADEAHKLNVEIQRMAGHEFKVNSPQQLQTVLFDELGLRAVKKIKTGFSTDATSLEAIQDEHSIVPLILRYREVEKLRSTYGAPLIDAVAPDGRIHATFNQVVARTGRLSSENPNLHNIPVRSNEGRRLRYAFLPSEGWLLAVSDYNQIELRILAHLSQDQGLLSAFASHEDVHRTIAASVFGVAANDVTNEQREQAKAVSYGLAYGMESFGLSQRLGVPVSVAKEIMERYFAGFPSLRNYMDAVVKDIRSRGYSRTEFGRVRPFPDLATALGSQRQAVERQAMNAGIQGLAADVFKSALVRLDRRLREEGFTARLILQVHDEVLVEAPEYEQERVGDVVIDTLTNAATLTVPLEVSLKWGENWAAAKG
jgi:DNA polymerase-1